MGMPFDSVGIPVGSRVAVAIMLGLGLCLAIRYLACLGVTHGCNQALLILWECESPLQTIQLHAHICDLCAREGWVPQEQNGRGRGPKETGATKQDLLPRDTHHLIHLGLGNLERVASQKHQLCDAQPLRQTRHRSHRMHRCDGLGTHV